MTKYVVFKDDAYNDVIIMFSLSMSSLALLL